MSGSGCILLADDNPTDAELIIRALKLGGVTAQVVWVQDGEAAVDYVLRQGAYAERATGNPSVVLLDLHMPRIDGLDVLDRIKADPGARSTPVVIMSSSDQRFDVLRAYEHRANSFIVKPVDFHQFTEQVGLLGRYWTQINRAG